jgi:hypothetical protein
VPEQQYKVDRDNLPAELRGVPPDALEGAIENMEKARNQSIARQQRQQAEHKQTVDDGKALDLIGAAKRCYTSGSSGTENITGAGGGH